MPVVISVIVHPRRLAEVGPLARCSDVLTYRRRDTAFRCGPQANCAKCLFQEHLRGNPDSARPGNLFPGCETVDRRPGCCNDIRACNRRPELVSWLRCGPWCVTEVAKKEGLKRKKRVLFQSCRSTRSLTQSCCVGAVRHDRSIVLWVHDDHILARRWTEGIFTVSVFFCTSANSHTHAHWFTRTYVRRVAPLHRFCRLTQSPFCISSTDRIEVLQPRR